MKYSKFPRVKTGDKKIGLIIGKFLPLHKGHQFLIETAQKHCDTVIVAIFDNPLFTIPINTRVHWLRYLYPDVLVVPIKDLAWPTYTDPKVWEYHEKLLRRNIKKRITHVFSGEDYGKKIADMFYAKNVLVDKGRTKYPISATEIRMNPEKYKKFLDPYIYDYFV